MKVKELIKELRKQDPEMEVWTHCLDQWGQLTEDSPVTELAEIEVIDRNYIARTEEKKTVLFLE